MSAIDGSGSFLRVGLDAVRGGLLLECVEIGVGGELETEPHAVRLAPRLSTTE